MKRTKDSSTERAHAATRLRGDDRFRSLADAAPAMLWVTRPDGSCSFLSREWYELTGQPEESGLGSGWLDAVHPADRERTDAAFARASAQGESKREGFSI
jgi:PAS domain S-box-containing protein